MDRTLFACRSCGHKVEESDGFCPRCGQAMPSAGGADTPDGPVRNENYPALVKADLFRLRRQWHLAEVECSEVLRRDPDNADAYSVMGDIYRDQSKLRDAIEWYRMALDRSPSSVTVRKKLEALIDNVFSGRKPEKGEGLVSSLRRRLSRETTASPRHPCSLTATVALALAVVFAIAVSTALLGRRTPSPPAHPEPGGVSGAFSPAPGGTFPTQEETPSGEATDQVPDEMAEALPSLEDELLARLRTRATSVDVNCQLISVEIDPRASSATIRFVMPRLWSPEEARRNMARVAAALAAETLAWDERLGLVKERGELRNVEGETQVTMLAESDRQTAAAAEKTGSGPESAFSFVWWHPDLRRAPDTQPSGPEG